jgi:hypothetical protein
MRGDEIAGGKEVADENPRLDFTLPDDVFSSDQPSCHLSAGLTLPSRFQSVPAGLGPDSDETCLPDDRERRPPWMVEPDGFEPTTSCLQSTRSTN